MFTMPRERSLTVESYLLANFEGVHNRLAALPYKQMFRANLLGPFYSTLYESFFDSFPSGKKIKVPLVRNPKGSKLQRQWDQIRDWFEGTTVLDEACSLLVTLAFFKGLGKEERDILEAFWVMTEDEEMQGKFKPFYHRFRLSTEKMYGGCLDNCVTKNEHLTFAEMAMQAAHWIYYSMACNGISNANEFFRFVDDDSPYPDDKEVVDTFLEQLPSRYKYMSWESLA
jgi:hypothetical protein